MPVVAQTASDTITVTATRTETRIADTPSSVVVLPRKAIENPAAPSLDDALRVRNTSSFRWTAAAGAVQSLRAQFRANR